MKKIDKYLDNKIYDDEDYLYDKTIKRIFKDYNNSIEYDYVVDENGYKYKSFERVVEDDGERYDLRNPSFTRYDSKAYYELSDVDFDDILDFDFIANATPEINNNVEANDTSKEIVLEKTSESISSKQTADCNESSSTTNNIKKEQTNELLEKVSSSNKPKIEHATLWENYIHERKTNKLVVMHLTAGKEPPMYSEIGLERIKRLVKYAKGVGIKIAFENTKKQGYLEYVLGNIKEDNVGICYDAGHCHFHFNGEFDYGFFKDKIFAVHLHDNDKSDDLHLLPFDGSIDWKNILTELKQSNYTGPITLEVCYGDDYLSQTIENFYKEAYNRALKLEEIYKNT